MMLASRLPVLVPHLLGICCLHACNTVYTGGWFCPCSWVALGSDVKLNCGAESGEVFCQGALPVTTAQHVASLPASDGKGMAAGSMMEF